MTVTARLGLAAVLWVGCMPAAQAADEADKPKGGVPEPSIATSLPPRLADPGGHRARLAERGITYGVNYIGEVLGVASGGLRRGTKADGRLEVTTDVDLGKLIGWSGLTFHANAYQIHGRSLTGENVGSLAPVSFIEATPATRLFEVWLEQSFLDGKVAVRAGQLAADSEFFISQGGGAFMGGTFGWPTIAAANLPDGGPAYPLAAPGARLKLEPSDRLTLLAGVFNGRTAAPCGSDDPQRCNRNGLELPLGDPVLLIVEGQARYDIGLPGTVKLGGWSHQGTFDDTRFDETGRPIAATGGAPRALRRNHSLYGVVDQMIYRLPGTQDKGIAVFARVAGGPGDRNLVDLYVEGGVTFTGMLAGRSDDVLAVGVARTAIARQARNADLDRNAVNGVSAAVRDAETVLEVTYKAQIVPGWTLQPDFQYFWHPGGGGIDPDDDPAGTTRPRDAAVVGLRTTINY